ncbi:16S rRNA (guanine(527)-N(7))-methyltransferase RsmG [Fusobacterium sp. PH5-44]|uniref:16S rRNA (guanine(527)-N(7))-methyltransferase RsmG n=1 Tax=unclassified Fusobacterium TaxID=2648384 RepID=UPI003D21CFC8
MKEYLKKGIKELSLDISKEKIDMLMVYLEFLQDYNEHTNLTAIRESKEIVEKHFLDTMLLYPILDKSAKNAIDIGTGAGFPGMVLAILNPDISVTLMDSVGKKTKFLSELKEKLKLSNVTVVTSRAEDYINIENRETYDIGLCRGVSKLNVIIEYILPFLRVGGHFYPQKFNEEEINEAKKALEELKGKIIKVHKLNLPYSKDSRIIIEIEKISKADKKYPRRTGVPNKYPLR